VQSEKVKRIFNKYGFADDKFIVSGSPKVDAIVNARKEDVDIPKNWIDKLSGKKVFLMNTHLSYFPTSFSNKTKSGNYAVRFHDEILKAIINKEDVGMIWRPHPLLKNMIMSRFQECGDYIKYFEETISQSSNCVVDYSGDYRPAFFYSHALISTWSSLVNEYMVTGKPVMIFQRQLSADVAAQSPLNRNINYFRFGKNGITFEEFIEMVSKDEDPMYEERMKMIRQGFVNIDGSAGEKAYLKIKNELL
jgi:CDP-glycerol glycerophosphotransferase (TagB/SpsB family)